MTKNSVTRLCVFGLMVTLFLSMAPIHAEGNQPSAAENMAANGVAVDGDNNVIVTGQVFEGGKWVIQTEKYAASDGHLLWSKQFDQYNYNIGKDVVVTENDDIIVGGSVNVSVSRGFDYCLIKYDADGTLIWHKTYHHKFYDTPWRVALDNANNIFVTGMSLKIDFVTGIEGDFWTIKCDASGTMSREVLFDESNADLGFGIAINSEGDVIVTGSTNRNERLAYCTLEYYNSLNGTNWGPIYLSEPGQNNSVSGVAVDNNDNVFITGGSEVAGNKDYLTVKYDANGVKKKEYRHDFGGTDDGLAIDIDTQNNVVVTGTSNEHFCTAKYDNNLNSVLWQQKEGFTGGAKDVVIDSDDNVIVTGYKSGDDSYYYTIKYSSAGTVLWEGGGGAPPAEPPVASFTFVPGTPDRADYVQFNDKSSGDITSWYWEFGDGATSTEINPTHRYTSLGDFEVTLTVSGPAGEDTTTKTVTITNIKPVAAFDYSPGNPTVNSPVVFDGSDAYDIDGSVNAWEWDFGDGGSDSGKTVTNIYTSVNTYSVTLTITDNDGTTSSLTKFVTVNNETAKAPIADFTWRPINPALNEPVNLDASDSYDEDGEITLYQWDWESDGTYSSEDEYVVATTTHTWPQPGTYNVTLKVTDNNGTTNTKTLAITVASGEGELFVTGTHTLKIANGEQKSVTLSVSCINAAAGSVSLDVLDAAGTTINITPVSIDMKAGELKDFLITVLMPDNEPTGDAIQLRAIGTEGVQSDIFEIQLTNDGDGGGGTPGFAALMAIGAILIALLVIRRIH